MKERKKEREKERGRERKRKAEGRKEGKDKMRQNGGDTNRYKGPTNEHWHHPLSVFGFIFCDVSVM